MTIGGERQEACVTRTTGREEKGRIMEGGVVPGGNETFMVRGQGKYDLVFPAHFPKIKRDSE